MEAAPAIGMHVGEVRFTTDRAMSERESLVLGERFVGALATALHDAGQRDDVHIVELVVEAPSRELDNARGLMRLAASSARRILDRASD